MSLIISLQDLLLKEIKELYDAEKQLVKALPKMAKAATNPDLRRAFIAHSDETKNHVARLDQVFDSLGSVAKGASCQAMRGLIEQGAEGIELAGPDSIRDVCLIGAARKTEHYEIAAYGTVLAWAIVTGANEAVELCQQTLDEGKRMDEVISRLSDSINDEAGLVTDDRS